MRKRLQRSAIVVPVLVSIVAAISVAAAMASSKNHVLKPHAVPSRAVSTRLDHIFSVLRGTDLRGRSASVGANPQPLPAAAIKGLSHIPGLDPSAAVFAGGTTDPVWVIPGSTELCLINGSTATPGDLGGVCGSISGAEEHGLAVTTESASGTPIVLGLVPNGNTSVKVTNTDGTTEHVPVTNNVYEIDSGNPSTVNLNEASGKATTRHLAILSRPPASAPAGPPTP